MKTLYYNNKEVSKTIGIIFLCDPFYILRAEIKKKIVRDLVQIRTRKFASEIYWPFLVPLFYSGKNWEGSTCSKQPLYFPPSLFQKILIVRIMKTQSFFSMSQNIRSLIIMRLVPFFKGYSIWKHNFIFHKTKGNINCPLGLLHGQFKFSFFDWIMVMKANKHHKSMVKHPCSIVF